MNRKALKNLAFRVGVVTIVGSVIFTWDNPADLISKVIIVVGLSYVIDLVARFYETPRSAEDV